MDNTCIRRSRLIKQFHFVVWTVLLLAVGLLGRRVHLEQSQDLPQSVAHVAENQQAPVAAEHQPQPVRNAAAEVARPQRVYRAASQSPKPAVDAPPSVPVVNVAESTGGKTAETPELSGTTVVPQDFSAGPPVVETAARGPETAPAPGVEQPVVRTPSEPIATKTIEAGLVQSGPEEVAQPVVETPPTVAQVVSPEGPALPVLSTGGRPEVVKEIAPQEIQRVTPKVVTAEQEAREVVGLENKLPVKNMLPVFEPNVLVIVNPKRIGYPVAFLYGLEQLQLQPGEKFEQVFDDQETVSEIVQFDRGGDFGEASLKLKPGNYEFTVTRKGWDVIRSKPVDPKSKK